MKVRLDFGDREAGGLGPLACRNVTANWSAAS